MIAKEVRHRLHHYTLLAVVLSALLAIYVINPDLQLRQVTALFIGGLYVFWGLWTHRGEIRTLRLVLEYVAIGTLGSLMLVVLARSI